MSLIDHIHRISLADHNDERRGSLVARVTSDIETLAEFFRWGGLAWLIDGTLMIIVSAVMLAYNWLLALIAIGISISVCLPAAMDGQPSRCGGLASPNCRRNQPLTAG